MHLFKGFDSLNKTIEYPVSAPEPYVKVKNK